MSELENKGKKVPGRRPSGDISKDLPEMVENVKAWEEYKKLQQHELLNKKRIYQTSDPNLAIDLAQMPHIIDKKIQFLPESEKRDILAMRTAVRTLLGKLSMSKQKAFGSYRGHYSDDPVYLIPRKLEVIDLFGRFYSVEEIHKLVNKDWHLPVSKKQVAAFKTKYADKIKELQEKYKKDYSHIRLGYKRSRLDEYTYLYNDRKEKYETSPTESNYKLLLQTLTQIKNEVEGDELKVTFDGEININHTMELHMQQEILQKISIKDIVISRLCAKFGVNHNLFMHRIHKSYYAQFSGTLPLDDEDNQKPIYPSQHIYDFNKIPLLNRQLVNEEKQIKEKPDVDELSEPVKKDIQGIKSDIIEKLRRKQEQLNKIQEKK